MQNVLPTGQPLVISFHHNDKNRIEYEHILPTCGLRYGRNTSH